ncbi:MAG TPA: thiamine diphosphokinase [Limnochordia bacterium]|nr:thiamine diphosphokinase [Limnochordia bacterium]
MNALIWAGGDYRGDAPLPVDYWPLPADSGWGLVVAADSGARHALRVGSPLDLLLGDFDSLAPALRERLSAVPQRTYPTDKNYTDAELAVRVCRERGADHLLLAGGLGTRFDQSLAAVQMLIKLAVVGVQGCATDGRQRIYGLLKGSITLPSAPGEIVSLLPQAHSVEGVRTEGLRWPLAGDALHLGESRSVSNEATGDRVTITAGGPLLIAVSAAES